MRSERRHRFLCQKWTLFMISLMILLSCIALALMSHKIAANYVSEDETQFQSQYKKESLEQALMGMAVMTALFALFGLIGALKEHYCLTLMFAVYMTINTLGNFYAALQSSSEIWVFVIINFCISVIAFTFAKQIRAHRLLSSSSSAFVINQPFNRNQNTQNSITISVGAGQHWHPCAVSTTQANRQWIAEQPPPPYYIPYSGYPSNKQFIE